MFIGRLGIHHLFDLDSDGSDLNIFVLIDARLPKLVATHREKITHLGHNQCVRLSAADHSHLLVVFDETPHRPPHVVVVVS